MGSLRVGIDLGGTKTVVGLIGEDGAVLKRVRFATAPQRGREAVIAELVEAVREVLAAAPAAGEACQVGIGIPGTPDYATGSVVSAPNLDWEDVPLAAILRNRLGLDRPVLLDQDTKAAAIAEKLFGAAQEWDDFLCLTIGTGVSAGIFVNGDLCRGAIAAAGEIGYTVVYNRPGEAVPGTPAGWRFAEMLEGVAAGPAIGRAWKAGADAEAVFRAARQGDEEAARIVAETARLLALGIMNAVHLLNPDGVVLGGGVSLAGESLFKPLWAEIRASDYYRPAFAGLPIVPARLGADAPLVGAAFLDRFPPRARRPGRMKESG